MEGSDDEYILCEEGNYIFMSKWAVEGVYITE